MRPTRSGRALARRLALGVALLAGAALGAAACGSPLVGAECEPPGCGELACKVNADCVVGQLCKDGACVKKPECVANADCKADSVCLAGACTKVEECVMVDHCPCDKSECVDHHCVGAARDCSAAPMKCTINADCPTKTYCVDSVCRLSVECLVHADCAAGAACYGSVCYAL